MYWIVTLSRTVKISLREGKGISDEVREVIWSQECDPKMNIS